MTSSEFITARKETNKLVDKLGKPIDAGILDTVTALRLHGIHTIGSCEGHLDRITGGPYVMFEAPGTHDFRTKYRAINDRKSEKYKYWHDKAIQENMPEIRKMLTLLNGFYDNRLTPNDQHIIIRCFDTSVGELMCQSADIAHILTPTEHEVLLGKNQTEMQAFAEYLKKHIPHKS
jgi:hypothetical protein